jgi:hypothetical protein
MDQRAQELHLGGRFILRGRKCWMIGRTENYANQADSRSFSWLNPAIKALSNAESRRHPRSSS